MTDKPINDGGPAFPRTGFYHYDGPEPYDNTPEPGMSLRAWLVGRYAKALISPTYPYNREPDSEIARSHRKVVISHALVLADETIAALEEPAQ